MLTPADGITSKKDRPAPLVYRVDEAAELLEISRALAYELVARGELPSLRLGRRLVVPRKALLELVELVDDSDDRVRRSD